MRLINQQIPDIIWTTDLDFKITSISGLSLMDIGVKPAELTGKSLQEIHGAPNEVIPNIAAHLRALDGERRATELQFKNRIWRCNIEPLLDANRKAMGCIGVAMDITESKDMEARLQALAAIVQTSDDAIISITPEQIITSWNQGAQKLFGYAAEEAIGKNISIIIPAEESSRTAEVIRKVTRGEPVESFEAVRRRKDGTLRDVSINVSRIANPAQKTIAISAILRDITPRKQMEKTVLSISAQERRRVGHELHDGIGQHLAGMAFKAKVLEQDLAAQASSLVPEARKIVELTNEAIRQTRLLASGFDPVDIEVGGLPTALRKLTQEISTLHDAACRFHCDVERMDLDKQINLALFRIAQEAITNAFRHGLTRQVDVALTADDNRITLTIRDNGRGFSIAGQQHHGRGLGIMSYRANSLGGKLLIRSEPGEGTEITCTFKKSAETKAA